MSDFLVINQCAPTLAGIKTGNLFSCKFENKQTFICEIRKVNCAIREKGVMLVPISMKDHSALLLMYRKSKLEKDLFKEDAMDILKQKGYTEKNVFKCVVQLTQKLKEKEFPHEIGLFLGYPVEDVVGFMHNRKDYKMVGTWKVYGDEEYAKECFCKYNACRQTLKNNFLKGKSMKQLTVAV